MEAFEMVALQSAPYKSLLYKRYVDDILIWLHDKERLEDFLTSLNIIYQNIKFTVELEQDGQLPFLDAMIFKKQDGTTGERGLQETHSYKPVFK